MLAKSIFTRQQLGLDYRIWRVMLIISVLSLSFLSYRILDSKKCIPVNFIIKTITAHADSTYNVGEILSLISSANKDETTWDFGDNTGKVTGQYVTHIYKAAGTYKITASTGSTCEKVMKIAIATPTTIIESSTNLISGEEIVGPILTITGKDALFTCMVTAKVYEWSITNYPKLTQTGPSAIFQFPTPGKYIVEVTLDNDREKRYTKDINVEAEAVKPVTTTTDPAELKQLISPKISPMTIPEKLLPAEAVVAAPEKNKTVTITDAIFKDYLGKVIDKKMTAADFDSYLCYKGDTKVILNGDLMTFNAMCGEISGKKKSKMVLWKKSIKIKTAEMRRDTDECVNIIEIKF
jgi:PKD domain